MTAPNRHPALEDQTSRRESPNPLELGLWAFLWISLVLAARAVWVGRADFLSFEIVSLYLWAGWAATFVYFLTPRVQSTFVSAPARRRVTIAVVVVTAVALLFGQSYGDTCELARLPYLLFHGSIWHSMRWLDFTPPHFSRCRALPTAMVGSLLGWFAGFQLAVAVERQGSRPRMVVRSSPVRPAPTPRGEPVLASTMISTAQKISVASGELPRSASAKCWHCGALLPPAPEDFVGRCRACGAGYRIVRAGAMLVAAANAPPNEQPEPSTGRWLTVLAYFLRAAPARWLLPRSYTRRRARAGVYMLCAALAIFVRFALTPMWSGSDARRELAAVITPYPGAYGLTDSHTGQGGPQRPQLAKEATRALELVAGHERVYTMNTNDSPARVMSFYRDPRRRRGRELVEDDTTAIVLRGNGLDVLVAADAGSGQGTRIFYYWSSSGRR